jgi:hypothetical protein
VEDQEEERILVVAGILAEEDSLGILVVGKELLLCFDCCSSQLLDLPGAPWQ